MTIDRRPRSDSDLLDAYLDCVEDFEAIPSVLGRLWYEDWSGESWENLEPGAQRLWRERGERVAARLTKP